MIPPMTKTERQQMTDLFWKICDTICVLQPELSQVLNKEKVSVEGMKLDSLDEMIDILRFDVLYTVFDLEACRRDISKLVGIIKSGGGANQEIQDEGSA